MLQTKSLGAGLAARGHQDNVGLNALCIPFLILEEHFAIGYLLHGTLHVECDTLHVECDTLLLHLLAETFGNVAIEGWQTLFQVFYHRHLAAETTEDAGELHADDACTDDGKALRQLLQLEQPCGIDDTRISLDAFDGEPLRLGTGSDDNRGLPQPLQKEGSLTKYCFLSYKGDVGMREDALDTSTQLRYNGSHTLTGLSKGGRVNVGFRGDTAYIQARASHLASLEDDDLQTLFGSIFSSAVTARSRTDNDQISCCH